MALTAVETTLQGLFDRLAFCRGAFGEAGNGGTDLWTRVDACGDETFENRIKGADLTAADGALADPQLGEIGEVRTVMGLIQSYCQADLALAGLDAFLTAQRWRLDRRLASIYREAVGLPLTAANVHADGDAGASCPGLAMGTLVRGGTLTDGAAVDTDVTGPSAVLARVTTIGSSDWTVTITVKRADATAEAIEQIITGTGSGGAVGDTYVLGAEAVASEAAADQKVVSVAATGQFAVGQQVLLIEWEGSPPAETFVGCEVATIAEDGIAENVSLTMVGTLLHTYSAAAFVYPLWVDVSVATGTGGTASDEIALFPAADRRLRL